MAHKTVSATEFKAKCLALIDEVNTTGDSLTITKRGKPTAIVQPVPKARKTTRGMFAGKLDGLIEQLDNPPDLWKDWDVYQQWLKSEDGLQTQPVTPKPRRKAS